MYIQSNSRCRKALTKPYRQLSAVPNLALLAREIPKISGPRASNTLNPDKDKAIFGASNPPKSGHTFRGASGGFIYITSETYLTFTKHQLQEAQSVLLMAELQLYLFRYKRGTRSQQANK